MSVPPYMGKKIAEHYERKQDQEKLALQQESNKAAQNVRSSLPQTISSEPQGTEEHTDLSNLDQHSLGGPLQTYSYSYDGYERSSPRRIAFYRPGDNFTIEARVYKIEDGSLMSTVKGENITLAVTNKLLSQLNMAKQDAVLSELSKRKIQQMRHDQKGYLISFTIGSLPAKV